MTEGKTVSTKELKEKALKLDDPIRTIILSAPDEMTQEEYVAKCQEWLKFLAISEVSVK